MILSVSEILRDQILEVLTCVPVFWFDFNNYKSAINLDSCQILSPRNKVLYKLSVSLIFMYFS